jgi:hypothetical protein
MTFWIADWLRMFALTLGVELAVATPLLRPIEARLWRRIAAVCLANLASHPLVWFVFPGAGLSYATRVGLSELWALLVEAAAYVLVWPTLRWRRALLASLCANGASVAAGLVAQRML